MIISIRIFIEAVKIHVSMGTLGIIISEIRAIVLIRIPFGARKMDSRLELARNCFHG